MKNHKTLQLLRLVTLLPLIIVVLATVGGYRQQSLPQAGQIVSQHIQYQFGGTSEG